MVVLFLDLVGWTRLAERVDPEPLQLLLEQYYEVCSAAVEEHGGVVEKFIGDAVMAVFGAARSEEDDAVRALRAAFQIRADVAGLPTPGTAGRPPEVHCGIAAGEALVTHSSRAGLRVVGDVVNLAARLQSTAVAGEIVVNETVAQLARPQFAMAPVAPLTLKGKAQPVPALLVVGPVDTGEPTDDGSPMVDRHDERASLRAAWHRVAARSAPEHVTVVGPPGIGKTRLVREVLNAVGAPVVTGSCPSYGPHGDHLALVQVLDALTARFPECRALVQSDPNVAAVLDDLRHASRARRPDSGPGPGVEEVSRVARDLLGAAAAGRPVAVVWDGLEWAGPSLLRLIGELGTGTRRLPVLTICVSRSGPDLPGAGPGEVVEVGALGPAHSAELAGLLAAGRATAEVEAHDLHLLDWVTAGGGGNPLFIRLMIESAVPGRPAGELPPTITALVGAMIDRLPTPARELLGAMAVIGSTFTLPRLAVLGLPAPARDVETLVEQHLVGPLPEPGAYRFVQQPVHEVAYGRLDKHQRLTWHRLLAQGDVSPAFHLDAAVRLLGDLRPYDPELAELSRAAGRALLRDGTAALRQRDVPAAIALLTRALELTGPGDDRDRPLAVLRLSDALLLAGDTAQAVDLVAEAAAASTDPRAQRACRVQRDLLAVRRGALAEQGVADLGREVDGAPDDRLAGCRFAQVRMLVHLGQGRYAAAEEAVRTALDHARALGDDYEQDRLLVALCEVRQWSPTPVTAQLAGCAELAARFAADRFLLVPVLVARARCLALTGDIDGANAVLAEAGAAVEELRLTMGRVLIDQAAGVVCSAAGAPAEAERHFRRAAAALETAGHTPNALTLRVQAARERARYGPPGAVTAEIATLLERRAEMDVRGRILCMSTAVRLVAGGDALDTGIGDVLALLRQTDDACLRGDVAFDLARAQRRLGRHGDALTLARAAIDSYAVVGATRPQEAVRAWM